MKKYLAIIMLSLTPTVMHAGQTYAIEASESDYDQKVEAFLDVIRKSEPKNEVWPADEFGDATVWSVQGNIDLVLERVRQSLKEKVVKYRDFQRIAVAFGMMHAGEQTDKTFVHTKSAFWQALASLDVEELDFSVEESDQLLVWQGHSVVIPDDVQRMRSLKTLKFSPKCLGDYSAAKGKAISLETLKMFSRVEFYFDDKYQLETFEKKMPEGYEDFFDKEIQGEGESRTLVLNRKESAFEE